MLFYTMQAKKIKTNEKVLTSNLILPDWLCWIKASIIRPEPGLLFFLIALLNTYNCTALNHKNLDEEKTDTLTITSERVKEPLRYSYGINLGGYFANPATANYYNGSGRNSLETAITRQHTYNRIRESLGYDFELPEEPQQYLPQNMRYNSSMLVGVFGNLHFNRISLLVDFNYVSLRLQDQFMLRILTGEPGLIGHDLRRFNIEGTEERMDIKVGMQQLFPLEDRNVHPYIEGGFNMINTRVKGNRVEIAGTSYNILNLADARYGFRDDGISFGVYAGGGLKMDVGESYAVLLGGIANYAKINLGDYDSYNLHFSIFIRLFLTMGSELSVAD